MPISQKTAASFLQVIQKKPITSFCAFVTLSLHICIIIGSLLPPRFHTSAVKQKLVVHTHVVPAGTFSTIVSQAPSKQAEQKTLKSKNVAQTQAVKKPAAKSVKTTAKTTTSTTQHLSNEQAKKLLKQLQKNLAEIETHKETSIEKTIVVPQSIKELKADSYMILSDEQHASADYHTILLEFLKQTLQLPAFGTVKVVLSLNAQGTFKDLEILASDSEVNRFYLEKQLKQLQYPIFTQDLSHTSTYSFNLTFCSDK